jgi:hypothetical protein
MTYADSRPHGGGVCPFCREFHAKTFRGAEALKRDLALQPGERVGITVSGGKDSTYMWGVLTDLLGADAVQAFTYFKPGVSSDVALANVKKAARVLGSEPVIVSDSGVYDRFRRNLRIFLAHPDAASVRVLLCTGCRYGITENLYRRGAELGIYKYISGASYLELAPFKEDLLTAKGGGDIDAGLEAVIRAYPALDYGDNLMYIRRDQNFKYKNNDTLENNFGADYAFDLFDFDDYFPNDPAKIEAAVVERFDWKKTNRSWHFDCEIEDWKDVFYFGLLGYTELDFKLSTMVRYGLLTRDEALAAVAKQAAHLRDSLAERQEKLTALGLTDCAGALARFYEESPYLSGKEAQS